MSRAWVPVALAAIATGAQAGPTALNVMPIADTLKHREAFWTYSLNGTESRVSKKYTHWQGLQLGLFDRLELGFDNDFGHANMLNLKVNVLDGSQKFAKGLALSGGWTNVQGEANSPYVVGRFDVAGLRLHGGYWRQGDLDQAMVGVDKNLGKGFSAMVEHVSARAGSTYAGVYYNVPMMPGLSVGAIYGRANDRTVGADTHWLSVTYFFKF